MIEWFNPTVAQSGGCRLATQMLSANRLPQTVIIEGAHEADRLALARFLSAGLLCQQENAPCGDCLTCRLIAKDGYADVTVVAPEKEKAAITVDTVREVRAKAFLAPDQGSRMVFIINGPINLQGQNAFLKCLEEPPKGVYFMILCSHHSELLDTVVSRGSIFTLTANQAPPPSADLVTECVTACGKAIAEGSRAGFLTAVAALKDDRLVYGSVLSELYLLLHRALTDPTKNEIAGLLSRRLTKQRLFELAQILRDWQQRLHSNPNSGLFFTALCAAIFPRR
ncbi:MAG: hypothetical protein IKT68_03825 [Clostridia bacterium]|nr:hypothetical protein [Clostridia bacterium]